MLRSNTKSSTPTKSGTKANQIRHGWIFGADLDGNAFGGLWEDDLKMGLALVAEFLSFLGVSAIATDAAFDSCFRSSMSMIADQASIAHVVFFASTDWNGAVCISSLNEDRNSCHDSLLY
jgi:hypothetical protein